MTIIRRFTALFLAAALTAALCIPALADESETTISLSQTSLTLAAGECAQLTATASDGQDVTWRSLTTDVVSVDDTGLVTALSEGSATVQAKSADGDAVANCRVTVIMAFPCYSLRVGERVTMDASLSGDWTSSDESVATVNGNGTVTARGFGRAYITVTDGSDRESFSVTVGGHVGIDISSWNNEIDWDALEEQGIEFVMIRVGYGEDSTDKRFVENIEGAIESGTPFGVYYYSYAKDTAKASREAAYCLSQLEPYLDEIDLPVAYDLEEYSDLTGEELVAIAETFCSAIQDAGLNAMVYANGNFYTKMDLSSLSDMGVDYWYAWYPTVPDLSDVPSLRGTSSEASIWQYSSSCVVQGALASGKTDINVLYMPEYLSFSAPVLTATAASSAAQLRWGGSTYASGYTLYKETATGEVEKIASLSGSTHSYTDSSYLPGEGYYVTMTVADPIDGTSYRSYTSAAAYPETAQYEVRVSAQEGGSASGGGAFLVGKTATVTATADEGYTFSGWYDAAGAKLSGDASYTFTVTQSLTLTAYFEKVTPSVSITFTDVADTDWYAEAVAYAVENGLFNGTSDTTFSPNTTMTRGMLITVLYRLAGSPDVSEHNKFSDVSASAWYAKAVTWGSENGIVNGTGDKTYSPEEPVTREQTAAILMRYSTNMGVEIPTTTSGDLTAFSDSAEIASYFTDAMSWAVSAQLLNGADGKLMPRKGTTRAECATILMRWLEAGD